MSPVKKVTCRIEFGRLCTVHMFLLARKANLAKERGQWPQRGSAGDRRCAYPGCYSFVYRNPDNGHVRLCSHPYRIL